MKHSKIKAILWLCLACVFIGILVNGIRTDRHHKSQNHRWFDFPFIIKIVEKNGSVSLQDKKTERFEFNAKDINSIISNLAAENIAFEKGSNSNVEIYYSHYPSADEELSFSLKNGILEIKRNDSIKMRNFKPASVTIELPDDEQAENYSFEINCVSGDIKADCINAKSFTGKTVSGNFSINEMHVQSTGSFKTVSGDIEIESAEACTVLAESVSGDINIMHSKADSVHAKNISGDARLVNTSVFDKIEIESSSGDVELVMTENCKNLSAKVMSGDVNLKLPEKSDFTATYKTVSGSVRTNFKIEGDKNGTISSGNGTNRFTLYTASGDIKIYRE